jgi:uncharacterized protein
MRLYAGTSAQFIEDTIQNQIAEKLKLAFVAHYQHLPSQSEMRSWRNSLRAVLQVLQRGKLFDQGVILEYQLPLNSKRLDCMVSGRDKHRFDQAVIVELKQWDKVDDSWGENEVLTWVGGATREVLHPSVQVGQYQLYLQDVHTAFHEGDKPVKLSACAYLHNYSHDDDSVLFSEKFRKVVAEFPIFTADDFDKLTSYLTERLVSGGGIDVLRRIEQSKYRPSRNLMEHVGNVIKGKPEYRLLDEQLVVYDKVFACAKQGFHDKRKTVLIVKGGPGTGKSVIALNLMANLMLSGFNAHYVTGSQAFTRTMRKIIGRRGPEQFRYTSDYVDAEDNQIDVLLCDEAHRIRERSYTWRTPKNKRRDTIQIDELIRASKVSVYFIDDDQAVRPNEVGSVEYIRQYAARNHCKISEYELETQFRCAGSSTFVNWIENTLGIRKTGNEYWNPDQEFDFRIFSDPQHMEEEIRKKVDQGFTGRVTAGYCWPWSPPNSDGTLKEDVVIADYKRPWNASPEARRLAPGIPRAYLWAYDPRGIDQIGCIYTAQGFEFDYVGVVMGSDLIYDKGLDTWQAHRENSHDTTVKRSETQFLPLVKNTYRVLLSRGIKGCYVYFVNKENEEYFRSRIRS